MREDWSDPDDGATSIAVLEELTRKASMGSVEARKCSKDHGNEVGRAVCVRSVPELGTSFETTDSGADERTRRLSSVRRGKLG